jgi:hypothetical protein
MPYNVRRNDYNLLAKIFFEVIDDGRLVHEAISL